MSILSSGPFDVHLYRTYVVNQVVLIAIVTPLTVYIAFMVVEIV